MKTYDELLESLGRTTDLIAEIRDILTDANRKESRTMFTVKGMRVLDANGYTVAYCGVSQVLTEKAQTEYALRIAAALNQESLGCTANCALPAFVERVARMQVNNTAIASTLATRAQALMLEM